MTLTIGAVVLGALAATVTQAGLAPWIAVLTTIAAAVAARAAAGSYDYQLVEYLRAAAELQRLRSAALRTTDPDELSRLVQRSEQILTTQNEGWLAKLSTDPEPDPGNLAGPSSRCQMLVCRHDCGARVDAAASPRGLVLRGSRQDRRSPAPHRTDRWSASFS